MEFITELDDGQRDLLVMVLKSQEEHKLVAGQSMPTPKRGAKKGKEDWER